MRTLFMTQLIVGIFVANLANAQIKTASQQMNDYLPLLKNKKVAIVANQSSVIGNVHLVDTLLSSRINVVKIFSPEHGFKGNISAGDYVPNEKLGTKNIPIISLYGDKKKPLPADLKGVKVVVFDLQDMGVRFFTFISTLSYMMEACAENNIPLIVLDRPNPHAYYVDGPVLEPQFASFVGLHPVPIVYGMTIGEYATMVNGEGWLKAGIKCNLKVIKINDYIRSADFKLVIPPSPNLRTNEALILYPSLCLFEGTDVSVGRGTDFPFEVIGKPDFRLGSYNFKPKSIPGVADNPPYTGKECNGFKLTDFAREFIPQYSKLYLFWLKDLYDNSDSKETFFNPFFDKLAGTDKLRKQITEGKSIQEIQDSWLNDINNFLIIRQKYLLYPDYFPQNQMLEVRPVK